MNKRIYKYQLSIVDIQSFIIPRDSKILSVDVQNGIPCIWVLVDTDNENIVCSIAMVGTGNLTNHIEGYNFLGTFQKDWFVGHVFYKF